MMTTALVGDLYQENDRPNPASDTPLGDNHDMADIHAAMMEELGIGRKDTLPLEDKTDYLLRGADHKVESLKPKKFARGVDAWRNATFNDVNPAEDNIDSIADGQLARIRRRVLKENTEEIPPNKKEYPGLAPSQEKSYSINGDLPYSRKVSKKSTLRGKSSVVSVASSRPPTDNSIDDRSNVSNFSYDIRKKTSSSHSVDRSVARLRAAVPSGNPSHIHNQHLKLAIAPSDIPRSRKPDTKQGRRPPPKKTLPERVPISKSAWGSLDENAFLAYAIKPTPPGSPAVQNKINLPEKSLKLTDQLNNSDEKPSSNKSLSFSDSTLNQHTTEDISHPSASEDISPSQLDSPSPSHLELDTGIQDLAHSISEKNIEEPARQQILSDKKLHDSKWANSYPSPISNPPSNHVKTARSYPIQDVIRAARVKVQKDSEIGQPGMARLLNQEDSIHPLLQLEQNGVLVAEGLIDDTALFVTDPMNTRLMIIYKADKNSNLDPTWRISFEFLYIKSNFINSIKEHRFQKQKRKPNEHSLISLKNKQEQKPVSIIKFPKKWSSSAKATAKISPPTQLSSPNILAESSKPAQRTSCDLWENEHQDFEESLICISSSNTENEPPKKSSSLGNCDRINTETFKDLSEIEYAPPIPSDSESTPPRQYHGLSDLSIKGEADMYDDILIETLYEDAISKPEGAILNYLSRILIDQRGSLASMKPEEKHDSIYYITELKKFVSKSLSISKVFCQLPLHIANDYISDKTIKLIEKRILEQDRPGICLSRTLSIALELVSHDSKFSGKKNTESNQLKAQNKIDPSQNHPKTHHTNGQNFMGHNNTNNLDMKKAEVFMTVKQTSYDAQENISPVSSTMITCNLIDSENSPSLPSNSTDIKTIDDTKDEPELLENMETQLHLACNQSMKGDLAIFLNQIDSAKSSSLFNRVKETSPDLTDLAQGQQQEKGSLVEAPHTSRVRITYTIEELMGLKTDRMSPREECLVTEIWQLVAAKYVSQRNDSPDDRSHVLPLQTRDLRSNSRKSAPTEDDNKIFSIKSSSVSSTSPCRTDMSGANLASHKNNISYIHDMNMLEFREYPTHYSAVTNSMNEHNTIISGSSKSSETQHEMIDSVQKANSPLKGNENNQHLFLSELI